ncbi:hypothetical protein ASC93_28200 [Massilia sp. Root335]|nr:hypothetical protein ASC93_28200 [Massilia sp. Root335]
MIGIAVHFDDKRKTLIDHNKIRLKAIVAFTNSNEYRQRRYRKLSSRKSFKKCNFSLRPKEKTKMLL